MKSLIIFKLIFIFSNVVVSSHLDPDENEITLLDEDEDEDEEPTRRFVAEADTRFLLFTKSNPIKSQQIVWIEGSIEKSNFNPAHPVRFLIHGWRSDSDSDFNKIITQNYLATGDYNVIV